MDYDCLIIDDEKTLADNTCEYFNMFEVPTKAVYSRAEAESFFTENTARMILLDINLSDGSGFDLCKHIREISDVPILFVSARNTDDDKLIALNIGGDDYIEKPYSLGVLLAKVRVVLKRYAGSPKAAETKDYDDGYLRTDSKNKTVYIDGTEKRLTNLEYKLLMYLIENKDRLVTKNELFENVWSDKFTTDGTLNVHIRKLREEIERDPKNPSYIETIWKEGYRFNSSES